MIGTQMDISIGIFLHEHSSQGSEASIHHDEEGFGSVWHLDYRGSQECFLEFDECVVLFLSLLKSNPFLGQVMKWSGECRGVRDQLSVRVAEHDEGSDCFY